MCLLSFQKKQSPFILYVIFIFSLCFPALGDVHGGSEEGANHSVRINITGQGVSVDQTDRFEQLMAEGKRLLQEEMDYTGATEKFEEARPLAITQAQKADVVYYLSLVYYSTMGEGTPVYRKLMKDLITLDYDREPDELLCPPRYIEIFREIKNGFGELKVQSDPVGADVYINKSSQPSGRTPLTIGVRAGTVILELKKGKKGKKAKNYRFLPARRQQLLFTRSSENRSCRTFSVEWSWPEAGQRRSSWEEAAMEVLSMDISMSDPILRKLRCISTAPIPARRQTRC